MDGGHGWGLRREEERGYGGERDGGEGARGVEVGVGWLS
jgi:hypothetical protein